MKNQMRIIFIVLTNIFTCQIMLYGQVDLNGFISDFENEGYEMKVLDKTTYIYDEFDDLYYILSNELLNTEIALDEETWSVFMLGQIGNSSILDDFRRYFLVLEVENNLKEPPSELSEKNYMLVNNKRYLLSTYYLNDGDKSSYIISGFDEDDWRHISRSKDPKIRLNNKIFMLNESTKSQMRQLSNTVDTIRTNLFDFEFKFTGSQSYEDLNREIIRQNRPIIVAKEEGYEQFELFLNEDGSVDKVNIKRSSYTRGLELKIINLAQIEKSFKDNWIFGKDTVNERSTKKIQLQIKIKKKN